MGYLFYETKTTWTGNPAAAAKLRAELIRRGAAFSESDLMFAICSPIPLLPGETDTSPRRSAIPLSVILRPYTPPPPSPDEQAQESPEVPARVEGTGAAG